MFMATVVLVSYLGGYAHAENLTAGQRKHCHTDVEGQAIMCALPFGVDASGKPTYRERLYHHFSEVPQFGAAAKPAP